MFGWLRKRRRKALLARAFPADWDFILERNVPAAHALSPSERFQLEGHIQVLVSEKNWEGCGGIQLTDEHRVTVAAHMARMALGFESEYFEETKSILIYPDAYLAKSKNHVGSGVVVEGESGRAGEAWYRGPVILSWADVISTSLEISAGRNVVIHEFAHQLDMRNGSHADGIPTIESGEFAASWQSIMTASFERLGELCRHGMSSVLDCYGTTNPAEFFAVACEAYFEVPQDLQRAWPEVHRLLERFFRPNEGVESGGAAN